MRYVFKHVDPKGGDLARRKIHKEVLGCQCYPVILEIGDPALIKYLPRNADETDECGGWHRILTSPVENWFAPMDESWIQIETENTIYILERDETFHEGG